MENVQRTYLPAAGRDWALPLYDPLVKLLGADKVRRTLPIKRLFNQVTAPWMLAAALAPSQF
jgi:hypothetical protein